MLKKLLICFSLVILPLCMFSQTIENLDTQEKIVGKIHFKKWIFSVYDAELFSEDNSFSWDKPFLLKVVYLRSLSGKSIAQQTVNEIVKQHPQITKANQEKYYDIFANIIPNVSNGDILYGFADENGYGQIYTKNNKLLGTIKDKQLTKYFFEIWLSDNSSNPLLSKQLRGIS